jgi:diguanylate cyclase (GGDEF)-like protein
MALLSGNVAAVLVLALVAGRPVATAIGDAGGIGVFAVLGAWSAGSRKLRSISAALGLLAAAAVFIDLSGGLLEAHFYFFVLIIVLTLYEDWTAFLVAIAFVLLHHGVIGMLDPRAVFDRAQEWRNPWLWASIHAAFIAAAGVTGIVSWRLNEDVRLRMREAHQQVQELSETDVLTGLRNRRRLMRDLEATIAGGEPTVLVLLDLDGFKGYNDTFGHPAGDALLVSLSRLLQYTTEVRAYRLGGDEFCALWSADPWQREELDQAAAAAMQERGAGFAVTASSGSVAIPAEAATVEAALRIADNRMYTRKHSSRVSSRTQSRDVLIRALSERHPELGAHVDAVSDHAEAVARRLGMSDDGVEQVRHAAGLHDIGKVALPSALLSKPGPLDAAEWTFMHQHTIIGERILRAAPALAEVAALVRSSHERFDGTGYPDRLMGQQIPIGSRIVAVCDAYDAMTTERPYSQARSSAVALDELRHCAGEQFDPTVVAAFTAVLAESSSNPSGPAVLGDPSLGLSAPLPPVLPGARAT